MQNCADATVFLLFFYINQHKVFLLKKVKDFVYGVP